MKRPRHNSFSADSVRARLARLQTIEVNSEKILQCLPLLSAELQEWICHCYEEYRHAKHEVIHDDGHKLSTASVLRNAKKSLRQQLSFAKKYILSYYHADRERRSAFGVEVRMPSRLPELTELAERVLHVNAQHKEEGIDYCMPDAMHQRLADLYQEVQEHRNVLAEAKSQNARIHSTEDQRFHDDSQRLRQLLAAWQSMFGNKEIHIYLLGMVNPKTGSRSGRCGTVQLVQAEGEGIASIVPDPKRPAPTSYQVQYKAERERHWQQYAKDGNTLILPDKRLKPDTIYMFRVRARNSHGYAAWSEEVRWQIKGAAQ